MLDEDVAAINGNGSVDTGGCCIGESDTAAVGHYNRGSVVQHTVVAAYRQTFQGGWIFNPEVVKITSKIPSRTDCSANSISVAIPVECSRETATIRYQGKGTAGLFEEQRRTVAKEIRCYQNDITGSHVHDVPCIGHNSTGSYTGIAGPDKEVAPVSRDRAEEVERVVVVSGTTNGRTVANCQSVPAVAAPVGVGAAHPHVATICGDTSNMSHTAVVIGIVKV